MTFNECKYCFIQFCNYYNGKTVKEIPNMNGMSSEIIIDLNKLQIGKGKFQTYFKSPFVIFWFDYQETDRFSLNYLYKYRGERKLYTSV